MGGQWWLPGGATTTAIPALRPANWAMSVLLLVGAILLVALARPANLRIPAGLLLVPIWIGAAVCVSHGLFGMVTKGLYVSGLHAAVSYPLGHWTAAQKSTSAARDLMAFEPWFLLEGVLLALAGRSFLGTATARRRCTAALIAAIAVIDVSGVARSVAHLHVAVS